MFKRFTILLFCLLLIFGSIIPFVSPAYADENLYNWRNATTNEEFAEAFRYYCKSRDLTLDGTVANVLTNGCTNIFNALCDGIGINVTALQGHIKYEVDSHGNKGTKWLLDNTGITFYNRLFAQFLQDNDLEVGDAVNNKVVYSAKVYEGPNGHNSLIYVFDSTNQARSWVSTHNVLKVGSSYIYDTSDYVSQVGNSTATFTLPYYSSASGSISNVVIDAKYINETRYQGVYGWSNKDIPTNWFSGTVINNGNTYNPRGRVVIYTDQATYNDPNASYYYIGMFIDNIGGTGYAWESLGWAYVYNNNVTDADIFITTNNTTINNNNYEGDTIINNDGDVVNPPIDTPPGGKDPGWDVSGGQGSSGDTIINFPDFELPDLNIDWSIQGLGNKFPFSIPFDIASLVSVLNAEPEAPRFEGTVNFGFTTWDYDINLEQFDDVAHACRIAELLLLVFGLILITRSIIKG